MVGDEASGASAKPALPQLRLDDLLYELQTRIEAIRSTRDRLHSLLDAVLTVGRGLELESVLRHIVEAAASLVEAKFAAMGVIGEDGEITQFLSVGVSDEEIARIGPCPTGRGILGELIRHPAPLRVADLSKHPSSYGFPPNHPVMKTFLGVPVRVRDEIFGNLYLAEKRGGLEFDEEDQQLLLTLATAAGVAVENARLYEEVSRRERWLEASSEVAQRLLSGAEHMDVLAFFAEQAKTMADADFVAIVLPVAGSDRLVHEITTGLSAESWQGVAVPPDTLTGTAFRERKVMVTPDVRTDERALCGHEREELFGPMLAAPLGGPERVHGVLQVRRRVDRPPFSTAVIDMLAAFSGHAAIALEFAERRRDAELLIVLQDRDRIARDLHDLAIQRLFATGMALEGASRLISSSEAAERVSRAVDDIDETIKLIRSTIFSLQVRESAADKVGLRARVLAEAEAAAPALGLMPALRFEGAVDSLVPSSIADHVIAVLREGLSNVAQHANAQRVEVWLSVNSETVLRIIDDGVGIKTSSHRRGLRNLASRATELGGTLRVERRASGGTLLEWQVPLD